MNQKTRYKMAGIIFAALLVYKLYEVGEFVFIWQKTRLFNAWLWITGQWDNPLRRFTTLSANVVLVCIILALIPLVILTINAFKENTNPKSKVIHLVCYAVGVFGLWVQGFEPKRVSYAISHISSYAMRYLSRQFLPVISVVLFIFALFVLMQTASEKKETAIAETDNIKINYYKGLLDQGVISEDEFKEMKAKIKKGEL